MYAGLKVPAALPEERPRCLNSTELLAFFSAPSYQIPAKLSRGRKKKCRFYIQLRVPCSFFSYSKYSIYVLSLLDKNPMMEFFTLLTKLIKFFFFLRTGEKKNTLICFIIKVRLWLNQLNLKHASWKGARLTLTVKVFIRECWAAVSPFKVI